MKKYRKYLYIVLGIIAAGLILQFIYKCPFRLIFNMSCPGCGFTRAVLSALRFKFADAFIMYPAWLLLCLEGCYLVFRITFRNRFNFNKRAEEAAFWVTIGIIFIQYFTRMYFGVLPV